MKKTDHLTATDFMMMDIHRPMTDEDIAETNPQARLDKSARPFQVVEREAESVGGAHEEAPTPRCRHCFGPMPCDKHANVETLGLLTSLDVTPQATLVNAINQDLDEVVIVGFRKDGSEFFASSVADAGQTIYHLQRAQYRLNRIIDGEDDEREPPSAA